VIQWLNDSELLNLNTLDLLFWGKKLKPQNFEGWIRVAQSLYKKSEFIPSTFMIRYFL